MTGIAEVAFDAADGDPTLALGLACDLLTSGRLVADATGIHAAVGRPSFTDDDRARAVELVAAGASWARAAAEVGCSKATVGQWVRTAAAVARLGF